MKEKFYQTQESENKQEGIPAIEIPEEEWKTLQLIAQRVGGDFDMQVKLGPPFLEQVNPLTGQKEQIPYVAFEDPVERSITINPFFIKENPRQAKRVAAHEGSHRAITRGYHEIGLPEQTIRFLESMEYLGFHSFSNIGLEDPRVNNWDTEKFPGLVELNREVYDEQLKQEQVQFIAPEVNLIISKIGRYPRYAQAASELLRFWHQGRYSQGLKPEIGKFLKRVQKYASEYQKTIPTTQERLRESEVTEKAQECFKVYHDTIWPEVKKLVEMDLHTEEQRQMLNEFRQKQQELTDKKQEQEQAKLEGNQEKTAQLQKEIGELGKELDPFSELSEEAKKEIEDQIDKAVQEAMEKLNKEIEEKQRQIDKNGKRQEEIQKEIEELEEKAKNSSDGEKGRLEKQIQEKKAEKLEQEMKQKQIEKELKDIQGALDKMESGKGAIPYPEDELSQRTKEEIEKLFQKLPGKKKKELREKAQEELADFEDAVNKELKGKLNADNPTSHKEHNQREKAEREAAQKSQDQAKERERIEKELERIHQEKMIFYEQSRKEVSSMIDNLYYRLRRILRPEEYGGEELGHPRGKEADMSRVMQSKKDWSQRFKMWNQEVAPEKKDYRFWHLIDLSVSMKGEKINETFKGFIAVGEAIDRIQNLNSETTTVYQGIGGFHSRFFPFKEMEERFTKQTENLLSTIPQRTQDENANTNTYLGTQNALENLQTNLGETGNFLLTFSDGEPNRDIRDKLKELLKQSKEERDRKKIKVGLVWLGEEFDQEKFKKLIEVYDKDIEKDKLSPVLEEIARTQGYNQAALELLIKVYGYDFGLVMPALKPKPEAKDKRNFAERVADLLDDIAKNPEKY